MARKIQPKSKVPRPKKGQTSEDYWRERESRQRVINIRDEARTAERINQIFKGMQDSIKQEIESFYQRYADKEGITLIEARGRVTRAMAAADRRPAGDGAHFAPALEDGCSSTRDAGRSCADPSDGGQHSLYCNVHCSGRSTSS